MNQRIGTLFLICGCVFPVSAQAAEEDVRIAATKKASAYLLETGQAEDGSFSAQVGPAITGLVITSLIKSGTTVQSKEIQQALKYSKGERCLIIDCDLQDPPELIEKMYKKMDEGFDAVLAKRKSRKGETFFKKVITTFGYSLINKISDIKIPENSGDFRLLTRKIVNYLNQFDEPNAFLRGLVAYVGFKQTFVEYDRDQRYAGKSKYNKYIGSIKIAFNGIFGFSSKPIFFMSLVGFLFAILNFFIGLYYILIKLVDPTITPGLSSTILIITFFSGLQLIGLGILGEYIGRIHDEVKKRPKFIIDKKINFDD